MSDVDDPVVTRSMLKSELKSELDTALEKQRQVFNEDMARYFAASEEGFRRWFGSLLDKTNATENKVTELRAEHEEHVADDTRHRAPRRRKA
jgi:hypothetical protein